MEQTFTITGMDCADCARTIERGVAKLEGIEACTLNYAAGKLRVSGTASEEDVVSRVRQLGYDVANEQEQSAASSSTGGLIGFVRYLLQRRQTTLALVGLLLILPGIVFDELLPVVNGNAPPSWVHLFSLAALAIAGAPIAQSAWQGLFINHEITINLLMTIAAVGAVIIGAYSEAGLVMVLFAIGEALEGYTMERARQSIRSLLSVAPQEAIALRPCIDCKGHMGQDGYTGGPCPFCGIEEQLVKIDQLVIGDTILVKAGERVAMDGRIVKGSSALNQAPITGESIPIEKQPGDSVFAGSINGNGVLEILVTALAQDNTISRMVHLVEEAQERRAPIQRFVDQFAKFYTPAVVAIAFLVATLPPMLFGQPFWNADGATQGWLYRALELLVVACPCALVISTPVTLVAALSNAARNGVLIKGGAFIEALSRIRAIAFDKTGTLTEGKPQVREIRSVNCLEEATCLHCDDLLALASAVERRSEHPLAEAVVNAANQRNLQQRYPVAESVAAQVGQGVIGQVNGQQIFIGNHRYFDANVPHDAAICTTIQQRSASGETPLMVSIDGTYQGYITVADPVRAESRETLERLQASGIQTLIMLTGDNQATAQRIADTVGVSEVCAELLPEQKVEAVRDLLTRHGAVAMVGDGINDAPALATATVGIAMGGSGSAQAIETADVSLMNDSLYQLPFVLRLCRQAMQTIRQNISFAIGVKILFLVAVLFGVGTLWLAVLADVGASLLVTLNGMRLLRFSTEK
ncbi:MAG: cation-translocating P-type ATPase [Caldilineaceae bacterium]